MEIKKDREIILVLDFGGQYKQLIARRVRECGVFSRIVPCRMKAEEIRSLNPSGLILTGGPQSVYAEDSPKADPAIFELGIPVLGICYGAQFTAHTLGGAVSSAETSEYGAVRTCFDATSPLFHDLPDRSVTWMSHTDRITEVPEGFRITARTENCPVAAMENPEKRLYAVQYHPEVRHTECGSDMIRHFVKDVCGCEGSWETGSWVEEAVQKIRAKIGDNRALLALSGGVDSSVAAALTSRAIGENLTCVFVDHGLMRKDEGDMVEKIFGKDGRFSLNFIRVNAGERFLSALKGVTEPEKKRKIIGETFIRVFEEEAKKLGDIEYLIQGTIYPDVVESGLTDGAVIKSHHNVGGLPENVGFKGVVEPLCELFKDEVRSAGRALGLPEYLVSRQPFPGPGLAIRIVGEITEEKVRIVQEADAIFCGMIKEADLAKRPDQYFAALTNMQSVGVMGDARTYDYAICLRAVSTDDFMTATATDLPYDFLQKCMNRIINEVKGVNRVLVDISSKPPATIELE